MGLFVVFSVEEAWTVGSALLHTAVQIQVERLRQEPLERGNAATVGHIKTAS